MFITIAVMGLVLGADAPKWEEAAKRDGITVYQRRAEGASVAEMRAQGVIDATPHEVWKAIRDYDGYPKNMPHTEYAKVLQRSEGDKVIFFHSVVNAPMVDKRDYVIRLTDESDWQDGKGFLLVKWRAVEPADGIELPKEKDQIVRVKLNNGHWRLEPREDGKKTWAEYYVHTDPGGAIPKFIVNMANGTAVPDVFMAIRKVVQAERAKAAKGK